MEITKDGAANSLKVSLHVTQFKKNPLIKNKGYIRESSFKEKKRVGLVPVDNESLMPTVRIKRPVGFTKNFYNKMRTLSMMDEDEERKFTFLSKPEGDTGCPEGWPKLGISALETKTEDTTIPSAHGGKYASIKSSLLPAECARQFLTDSSYLSELSSIPRPLPQHSLQTYRYRIESIGNMAKDKFPKDLSLYSDKKTLCIDIRGVLTSISTFAADNADVVLPINGGTGEISINLRPFVYDFLEDVKAKYELIMYSSLSSEYLQTVLDYLEKQKKYFEHRFDETFCLFANISYGIKCLDFLLENRELEDIVVVDTSVKTFPLNIDNVIPISRYEPSSTPISQDTELVKLAAVLDLLAKEEDVRVAIKKYRTETT